VLVAATGLPLPPEPGPPSAAENSVELASTRNCRPRATGSPSATGGPSTGGGPAGCSGAPRRCVSCSAPTLSGAPRLRRTGWQLPETEIQDAPRFAWRGLMLDVSRHFMPKDGVLRYLDLMAAHKLNVFHFHLTDDQGWRIEIKRYPKLTETGSWRARTKFGHRASPLWEDKPHGGFYTQDDIREIVAYAAERHIAVVPEIDIPGHSQAAIAAYPELGNTDVIDTTSLSVWDTWGVSKNVLAPTDNVLRFYEGVFEELLDLFPADAAGFSEFVHIGGDECAKDQWEASPDREGADRRNSGSRTRTNSSRGSSGTSTTG
jgi:hexosaminidase